jgi:predicted nucleic acid-binding Zn ribbon protein
MTPDGPQLDEHRRRQRGRAIAMAVVLAAFVVLLYFITIAKMSGGGQ